MEDVFRRTNTCIRLTPCRNADKAAALVSRLADRPEGAELYRVRTAKAALGLLRLLRQHGRSPRLLLPEQISSEQLQAGAWFASADAPSLIVAEPVPLPLSRPDVRNLFIMNLPPSLAVVLDDLAAAGRDGLDAAAEVFASGSDRAARRAAETEEKVNLAVAWMEHDGCARQFIARHLSGKKTGVCGNCGWCLGKKTALLPVD